MTTLTNSTSPRKRTKILVRGWGLGYGRGRVQTAAGQESNVDITGMDDFSGGKETQEAICYICQSR